MSVLGRCFTCSQIKTKSAYPALEATQGQMDGFCSQLLTNATSKRWHLWEIDLRFALNSTPTLLHPTLNPDTSAETLSDHPFPDEEHVA